MSLMIDINNPDRYKGKKGDMCIVYFKQLIYVYIFLEDNVMVDTNTDILQITPYRRFEVSHRHSFPSCYDIYDFKQISDNVVELRYNK